MECRKWVVVLDLVAVVVVYSLVTLLLWYCCLCCIMKKQSLKYKFVACYNYIERICLLKQRKEM